MDGLETRHSIPTNLQILLADLDFLGQIKRNTKPCISDKVIVEGSSWTGSLYRFLKGENRTNAVMKIEQIVTQTVDAIETHKNSDHIKIIINYFSNRR